MGSLDSATSGVATNAADNTTQETTLATIRSVSGDWDNSNVSTVPNVSAFTSSGTFIAPAACSRVEAHIWGAGGSGGKGSSHASTDHMGAGGGGGYCLALVPLSAAGAHIHVTIGAGGSSRTTSGYSGVAGSASSISLGTQTDNFSATGGGAGTTTGSSSTEAGGDGGIGKGGILNLEGGSGGVCNYNAQPGSGQATAKPGAAPFIGVAPQKREPNTEPVNTGCGGTAGLADSGSNPQNSGSGGDGLVLFKW